VKVTADTITDEQIRAVRQEMVGKRRQNAYTRAIRQDCDAALDGNQACRQSCADALNRIRGYVTAGTITENQIALSGAREQDIARALQCPDRHWTRVERLTRNSALERCADAWNARHGGES